MHHLDYSLWKENFMNITSNSNSSQFKFFNNALCFPSLHMYQRKLHVEYTKNVYEFQQCYIFLLELLFGLNVFLRGTYVANIETEFWKIKVILLKTKERKKNVKNSPVTASAGIYYLAILFPS